jgi:group I intron endonuclease
MSGTDDTTYIYILTDPRNGAVRYVGKSDDPERRYRRHLTENGRTHRHNWIKQLVQLGLQPMMDVIESVPKTLWEEREIFWIAHYRALGHNLTNMCEGGNGASGLSPSDETRRKLSESGKRAWAENPRPFPETAKLKVAAIHQGRKRPIETGQRISQSKTGSRHTIEARRKMSEAKRGRSHAPHSDETRRKIGSALSGEGNGQSKLTMEKAREIRARYAVGDISLSRLGREYGVDTKQIHRIIRNESWRDENEQTNNRPPTD